MQDQELSESGNPIYRYKAEDRESFTPAIGSDETIQLISNHIETHVGNIYKVFHEMVSDLVHIDLHWVKPTTERPFHVLVTSGMSDMPMTVPEGFEGLRYAELCVLLPPNFQSGGSNTQSSA